MPVDHERIRANGWRQGRVFTEADTTAILDNAPANARLILVSHDCDIVHAGDDESFVEVCVAELLNDGVDSLYCWARHPRRLDIEIQIDGGGTGYCLEASQRKLIDRSELEQYRPDHDALLPGRELTQLTLWLSNRYTRVALPDAFNERRRPSQNRVKRILRRNSQHMSGLMIAMLPQGEPKDDQDYEIQLVALMLRDDFKNDEHRGQVSDAIQAIAAVLQQCDGIEVVDSDARSEENFSFHDARYFVELSFDDLSLREDPEHPRLP